ncbi:hypothetical protein P3S68_028210 [Capsicum galapagoense]
MIEKLIFVSNRAPKYSGLEKKKVNFIRASTDPRIDKSTDKWKEGVLLYGPPGMGEKLLARAISSNIDANFLKVVSSAIIDKYIGESTRLIREMFNYASDHQPYIIFMDEIDAIGGCHFSKGTSAYREIQRMLMELLNYLDGNPQDPCCWDRQTW